MLTDKELYKGLTKEQIALFKAESQERRGEEYARVELNPAGSRITGSRAGPNAAGAGYRYPGRAALAPPGRL